MKSGFSPDVYPQSPGNLLVPGFSMRARTHAFEVHRTMLRDAGAKGWVSLDRCNASQGGGARTIQQLRKLCGHSARADPCVDWKRSSSMPVRRSLSSLAIAESTTALRCGSGWSFAYCWASSTSFALLSSIPAIYVHSRVFRNGKSVSVDPCYPG